MNCLNSTSIGDIHITVYQTEDNKQLFYTKADNYKLLPILNYLNNSLADFKTDKC